PGESSVGVVALAVHDGALVKATTQLGGRAWDGASWQQLGATFPVLLTGKLLVHQGELILSGLPTGLARWTGASWQPIANVPTGSIRALAARGPDLFVGGRFFSLADGSPANHIARWDGTTWH